MFAAGAVALAAAFVAVGFIGVDRYARNYWLYRGFPPPRDPGFVTQSGTQEHLQVGSAALGGRSQDVYVYLPPGYADSPTRRYPVMYLLHGFPGRPLAFLLTVRLGVIEDELVAKRLAQSMILVMPFGSTGTFTDKEWANGVTPGEDWATFVSRDVVDAIDTDYRTIASPAGRTSPRRGGWHMVSAARALAASIVSLAIVIAASGWLYVIQPRHAVAGPPVGDALPLDELSRRSAVPLLVFLAVWGVAAVLL